MSVLTTMNLFKNDMETLEKGRLKQAAECGKRITWPEYISHIAGIVEHLGSCERCKCVLHSCIGIKKNEEGDKNGKV